MSDNVDRNQGATGRSVLMQESGQASVPSRTVLFVGLEDAEWRGIVDALATAPERWSCDHVPGYLHAIGHLTTGGEADTLVGRADAMEPSIDSTVHALKRASPRARLVLYTRPGIQRCENEFRKAGFEVTLGTGATTADILRAVTPGGTKTVEGIPSTKADEVGVRESDYPVADGPIGDVDLIECLLDGHHSIRKAALSLVIRQSGIASMAWVAHRNEIPAGNASAAIAYGQWNNGFLHAEPPVKEEQLSPWAGWLARWLALEKHQGNMWGMAMRDDLTGVWNRRYFDQFLKSILERAAKERFNVTVMVFDIDDFKTYNDRFGHPAGDDILRDAARLMVTVVREHDVVARIGGDEFAVIFWDAEGPRRPDSRHPHDVVVAARRFQRAICEQRFPKLSDARSTLSVSGGLAGFPWDGRTAEELLAEADQMALQSKRQGKNAFTFGPGARRIYQKYLGDR